MELDDPVVKRLVLLVAGELADSARVYQDREPRQDTPDWLGWQVREAWRQHVKALVEAKLQRHLEDKTAGYPLPPSASHRPLTLWAPSDGTVSFQRLRRRAALALNLPESKSSYWTFGTAREAVRTLTAVTTTGRAADEVLQQLQAVNSLLLVDMVLYADLVAAYVQPERTPDLGALPAFYATLVRPVLVALGGVLERLETTVKQDRPAVLDDRTAGALVLTLADLDDRVVCYVEKFAADGLLPEGEKAYLAKLRDSNYRLAPPPATTTTTEEGDTSPLRPLYPDRDEPTESDDD
jgi:hypothetical protein